MPEPIPFVDLGAQSAVIRPEVEAAIERVLRSQTFVLGPEVEAFEAAVAEYVGVRHALGVASGTDALVLALRALEAEPGSEVIVPAFTFFATAGAVWHAGLRPVFCDVDPHTYTMSADAVEAAWTDRTVGLIPVHLFGRTAPMPELMELATRRGAFVLEDAAQAIGATGPAGPAGATGDAGAFSFFPTKNLGGYGDGGLVTTHDPVFAARVAKLRVHGGSEDGHHEWVGTNSRLDALQAAVLRVKLRHLEGWTALRARHAARYRDGLGEVPEVLTPPEPEEGRHVYHQFTVRVRRRDELRRHLAAHGVETAVYYPVPLHLQRCFSSLGGRAGTLPVTERLAGEVLSLPVHPGLSDAQIDRVCGLVRDFFR